MQMGEVVQLQPGLRRVPLDQLHESPRNPRRITDEAFNRLAADLRRSPAMLEARPLIALLDGEVICGNMRLRAMKDMGWTDTPAYVADLDRNEQIEWLARDNNPYGDWHQDDLASLVAAHEKAGGDVEALGFARPEIDELLARAHAKATGGLDDQINPGPSLSDRFLFPPFTLLDARSGAWRERKRQWVGLGIESEVGRTGLRKTAISENSGSGGDPRFYEAKREKENELGQTLTTAEFEADYWEDSREGGTLSTAGTSIFDPVLCEIVYRWFSGPGARVLDPFAGGSVRGIVAARLGREYVGIDLRREQIEANIEQGQALVGADQPMPAWLAGDARDAVSVIGDAQIGDNVELHVDQKVEPVKTIIEQFDLLFTCPPYWNREVYSTDERDLSTINDWDLFLAEYALALTQPVQLLGDDRFAAIVVGDLRARDGRMLSLVQATIAIMRDLGCDYYNEAIYLTPVGSLRIRAGRHFVKSRKLGRTHQQLLIFCKGDAAAATEAAGEIDADALDEAIQAQVQDEPSDEDHPRDG
jgi:ParB-like chromosome segregation protein Spo0J